MKASSRPDERQPDGEPAAASSEKAVSGPPEDKSMKRAKPCPKCGAPLAKYAGTQAHKLGRDECPSCGFFSN